MCEKRALAKDEELKAILTFLQKTKDGEYTPIDKSVVESREQTAGMTFIRQCDDDDYYYSMS